MNTKVCSKCKIEKSLDDFHNDKSTKDKKEFRCKACSAIKYKLYLENETHRERKRMTDKRWFLAHPEMVKKYSANKPSYYSEHKEQVKKSVARWQEGNKDKIRVYIQRANKKKRGTQKGKLNQAMSGGVWRSLRKNEKNRQRWEVLVGYTVNDLKEHLEKKFKNGMTWERFLNGEIHIDHKIPLAVHNFEKPTDIDFKKCWALSNLQPLWAIDNFKKNSKITKPFQPSLAMAG